MKQDTTKRLIWDSEALYPKDEGETWDEYKTRAGISTAGVMDPKTGFFTFYAVDDENGYDLESLACALEGADEVISYNGVFYDTPVLSAALGRPIAIAKEVDVCQAIFRSVGYGWPKGSWKLDNVAKRTLGYGKTAEGAMAPTLWQECRYGELFTYLLRDVWILWKVWQHIRKNGAVKDPDGRAVAINL